jgi:copper chaperone
MSKTTLKVKGMTCGHCVHTVKSALEGTDGVEFVEVDLGKGRAEVEYDDAKTTPRELAGIVSAEGYMAEELPA